MPDEYLTAAEAARMLRVDASTVRRWVKSGRLKAISPGRKMLILAASVTKLIKESAVEPDKGETGKTE